MIIKLKDLTLDCYLGVYDFEHKAKRPIVINIEIDYSDESSCRSDNLSDTLDYDIIIKQIKDLIADKRFDLIEKLAFDILQVVFNTDEKIIKAVVTVDKPKIIEEIKSTSVTLTRKR